MAIIRTLRLELTDDSGDIDPLSGDDCRRLLREIDRLVSRLFECTEATDIEEMDRQITDDENPREKGDDDGQEYGHPDEAIAERQRD